MYRLDFSLSDKSPYAIQYKEPCKGVLVLKSQSNKYVIKICADLHYTISNIRFGMIQLPKLFGKVDFKFKPLIFPGVEPSGTDLINICKSVYMHLANIYGPLSVICDGVNVESNFNFEELEKIFKPDTFFKKDVEEKRKQEHLAKQKKEDEIKKLRKDLDKFDKELFAKVEKERMEFIKKNKIPLPKQKAKGRDKLLWKMGN
jgi:hypothetical protein